MPHDVVSQFKRGHLWRQELFTEYDVNLVRIALCRDGIRSDIKGPQDDTERAPADKVAKFHFLKWLPSFRLGVRVKSLV
jgi:hypothetical protein